MMGLGVGSFLGDMGAWVSFAQDSRARYVL